LPEGKLRQKWWSWVVVTPEVTAFLLEPTRSGQVPQDFFPKRTEGIVNNARFLILPWVRCCGLASRILSGIVKPLRADWSLRYGYQPRLLESFVEIPRFTGAS
jgi:hypothetical protein